MSGYLERACPCCRTPAPASAVAEVTSEPRGETLPLPTLREHFLGFFKEKSFFSYVRCATCGLLFAPVYFTPQQLGDLYGDMPDNTADVDLDLLRATQSRYVDALEATGALDGGYLEIGPDIGLFTHEAARRGRYDQFWLFEPNRRVHAQLAASVGERAHQIRTEFLDLSAVPDGSVRAAVMIHVLDHILDPRAFLEELKTKLRPDAAVVIVTHDERSLLARALNRRWPAYCLQHPQLFSPESMAKLLESAGLRSERILKTANHFPVTYLAAHLGYALGLGQWRLPKWSALSVPLKLGNILTVGQKEAAHA